MIKSFKNTQVGDLTAVFDRYTGSLVSVGKVTRVTKDWENPEINELVTIAWEINDGTEFSYSEWCAVNYHFMTTEKDLLVLMLKKND